MRPMTKTISPPYRSPRISVPVSEEVLEVFKRLAKASNMSTGAAIAEWLGDTVEAAEYMALQVERARAAPKAVMREMHAYALGLADETGEMMRTITSKGEADRARSKAKLPASGPLPPSCNTGGKVPTKPQPPKPLKPGFPLPPAKVQAYADTNGVPPSRVKPNGKAVLTPQSRGTK